MPQPRISRTILEEGMKDIEKIILLTIPLERFSSFDENQKILEKK